MSFTDEHSKILWVNVNGELYEKEISYIYPPYVETPYWEITFTDGSRITATGNISVAYAPIKKEVI